MCAREDDPSQHDLPAPTERASERWLRLYRQTLDDTQSAEWMARRFPTAQNHREVLRLRAFAKWLLDELTAARIRERPVGIGNRR